LLLLLIALIIAELHSRITHTVIRRWHSSATTKFDLLDKFKKQWLRGIFICQANFSFHFILLFWEILLKWHLRYKDMQTVLHSIEFHELSDNLSTEQAIRIWNHLSGHCSWKICLLNVFAGSSVWLLLLCFEYSEHLGSEACFDPVNMSLCWQLIHQSSLSFYIIVLF